MDPHLHLEPSSSRVLVNSMPSAKLVTVVALVLSAGFPLEALATVIFEIVVTPNGFDTASVPARPGHTINFILEGGATVMRSTFDAPCTPYNNPRDAELEPPYGSNGYRFQQVTLPDTYDGSPLWFTTISGCKQGVVFAINPSDSEMWEVFRARAIQTDPSATTSGEDPPQSHSPPTTTSDTLPFHLPPGLLDDVIGEPPADDPLRSGSPTSTPLQITNPRTDHIPIGVTTSLLLPSNSHQPPTPTVLPPDTSDPSKGDETEEISTGDLGDGADLAGQGDAVGSSRPSVTGDVIILPNTISQGRPTATRTIARLPGTTIVEVQYDGPTQSHSLVGNGLASPSSKPPIFLSLLLTLASIWVG
ncbi:hypothetical protein BKA70DRAFT_1253943 [Coprinopsis sp. MPI-PUGE-AT-0042]|nr:hypothetical protein BKA70DRAFT_1253943 [Coprinopsis sp. MPI-PUGE-AT-0042]